MSMVNTTKDEMEKMYLQLKQAEDHVECLKQELELKKGSNSRLNFPKPDNFQTEDSPLLKTTDGGEAGLSSSGDHDQDLPESVRSEATVEVMENEDQMAELEAELEAELQLMERNLTGESSHKRHFSGLSDVSARGCGWIV